MDHRTKKQGLQTRRAGGFRLHAGPPPKCPYGRTKRYHYKCATPPNAPNTAQHKRTKKWKGHTDGHGRTSDGEEDRKIMCISCVYQMGRLKQHLIDDNRFWNL